MYVLVSEHKNCMRIPLEKEKGGPGGSERVRLSQSDYIVILKIFRSSSKTLNIVTGSRVPPGRRRWSVCGGWVGGREGGRDGRGRGVSLGTRQILPLQQQHASLAGLHNK